MGDGYVYVKDASGEIASRQLCWSAYAPVNRKILEEALALMISLEPSAVSGMSMTAYQEILEKNKADVEKATFIMRQYGHKIAAEGLEMMVKEYDEILSAYTTDPIKYSVASSSLRRAWDGIGDWKL